MVLKDKTLISADNYEAVEKVEYNGYTGWLLQPGAYALTFNEKVTIPTHATGIITSRSSIYRGGASTNSPLWDPGFTTGENTMGTSMMVNAPIFIEENARTSQFYMIENPTPDELYSGQFQNKTNY